MFAKFPGPGLNGSHLDMLHLTPYCVGIAHEVDNVYWTFNGNIGSLDRYDFAHDHGPGYDDHSDGEIYRYVEGELERVPNVPSQMAFHKDSGMLYVADTGNSRIVMLDPSTGEIEGSASPVYEPLAVNEQIGGAVLVEIVPPGLLEMPSGLLLHEDILYVSDNGTSKIHAFDLEGNELRSLETILDPGALSAMAVGPDGKLYIASMENSRAYRIDVLMD